MTTATTPPSAHPSRPIPLAVGDVMPAEPVGPLTRTDLVRYAGAGGDFNPIHHDENLATTAGFPGVFAMGLLHAGTLGMQLARWVGPQNLSRFEVRFTAQVWPGDVLRLEGEVVSINASEPQHLAEIHLRVLRQTGEVAVTATAHARIATAGE